MLTRKNKSNLISIVLIFFMIHSVPICTIEGEFDSDGCVDKADLLAWIACWLSEGYESQSCCMGADLNQSENVDLEDFAVFSQKWQSGIKFDVESDTLRFKNGEYPLAVSLKFPKFIIEANAIDPGTRPISIQGNLQKGELVNILFEPVQIKSSTFLEAKLFLQWSTQELVLRKWIGFRLIGETETMTVNEIFIDTINVEGLNAVQPNRAKISSYPVFLDGFFAGIEFPVAATRLENDRMIFSYYPGRHIQAGRWYDSHKAVFGAAKKVQEKQLFQNYHMNHK